MTLKTWRLHTKPYKLGQNAFPNIPHMNYRTDLILGEAFCIFFHFPASGLAVLTGLHFYTFSPPRELNLPKAQCWSRGNI